jgi:hypothetical protein
VTPKRKNKNLGDSPRLQVPVGLQTFNSLLLDNLVDNGTSIVAVAVVAVTDTVRTTLEP